MYLSFFAGEMVSLTKLSNVLVFEVNSDRLSLKGGEAAKCASVVNDRRR